MHLVCEGPVSLLVLYFFRLDLIIILLAVFAVVARVAFFEHGTIILSIVHVDRELVKLIVLGNVHTLLQLHQLLLLQSLFHLLHTLSAEDGARVDLRPVVDVDAPLILFGLLPPLGLEHQAIPHEHVARAP
mmetsp:Transcript_32878/g.32100  ORF Transcript_32878/g.32100 Transcript_32878/m.32100 type:complete len:131 (-) Transcript_32878:279-671(-)